MESVLLKVKYKNSNEETTVVWHVVVNSSKLCYVTALQNSFFEPIPRHEIDLSEIEEFSVYSSPRRFQR